MAPASEPESPIVFYCSGRCPKPLESAREAPEIDFGPVDVACGVLASDIKPVLKPVLGSQTGS